MRIWLFAVIVTGCGGIDSRYQCGMLINVNEKVNCMVRQSHDDKIPYDVLLTERSSNE